MKQPGRLYAIWRNQIAKEQNYECFYCGCGIRNECVLDHLIPKCENGSNQRTNRVAACRPCDRKKSRRHPTADEMTKQIRILTTASVSPWSARATAERARYITNAQLYKVSADIAAVEEGT